MYSTRARAIMQAPLPRAYSNYVGHQLLRLLITIQGLGAFALITLGVMLTKLRSAPGVILPLVFQELRRSGLRLMPMFMFMAGVLGLLVIGQTLTLLYKYQMGSTSVLGTIMVAVVVRELGPLITAMLVLSRSGTANVIELSTARALGEVEALEAMAVDPVHYLVMPRVIGMALGMFSLTIYFIMGALLSGYLWAFLQTPLRPGEYFGQLVGAMNWLDFVILALKSSLFGALIAVITCYHGLAQPLRLEHVSQATVRAVTQCIIACVALDAVFIFVYLFL